MQVRIGTSGYSFRDWVGAFYPAGTRPGEMLAHYARHFRALEVNASYYRIPSARTFRGMAERTPPEFEFLVKAHGDMTHKGSLETALYDEFRRAVEPLREAGKFHGVLAQFPWGFRRTVANRRHLAGLHAAMGDLPLFVEFRHASWLDEKVYAALAGRGIGWCSVDEPQLEGLLPPEARATTDTGYVRLHGRNAAKWWGGGGERYDYDYSEAELREWAAKVKALADRAKKVYIFFNNCHAGHAAKNARLMEQMMLGDGG